MFKNIVNVSINVWERNVGGCHNWQKHNQPDIRQSVTPFEI